MNSMPTVIKKNNSTDINLYASQEIKIIHKEIEELNIKLGKFTSNNNTNYS